LVISFFLWGIIGVLVDKFFQTHLIGWALGIGIVGGVIRLIGKVMDAVD